MLKRSASLCLLILCLTALPAVAGTLYENGPIDGTSNAWTINNGFFVDDSFTIVGGTSNVTGISFGAWLSPGDTLQTVEVSITSQPGAGTTYFDGVVNFMQSGCVLNTQYNYDICTETGLFHGPGLGTGTYYLNLMNAVSAEGNYVYWDQNDGVGCHSVGCPSLAFPSGFFETIPSESFSILGNQGTGTTPEPDSLGLLATGVVGVGTVLRRRFWKSN